MNIKAWLATKWWRLFYRLEQIPRFKPCVIEYDEMKITEMLLRDCLVVYRPWPDGSSLHSVDLGYDTAGNLVGIKIWDKVGRYDTHEN